jgi:hypothetical protein
VRLYRGAISHCGDKTTTATSTATACGLG